MHQSVSCLQKFISDENAASGAKFSGRVNACISQCRRPHVIDRHIGEIAGEEDCIGKTGYLFSVSRFGITKLRRLAVRRAIFCEPLGAKRPCKDRHRRFFSWEVSAQAVISGGQIHRESAKAPAVFRFA
jgi:hypothetical protein